MTSVRISRPEKDHMRKNLEFIIQLHKDIGQKIEIFQQETRVDEYQRFWHDLHSKNNENIQTITAYMVRKCNR